MVNIIIPGYEKQQSFHHGPSTLVIGSSYNKIKSKELKWEIHNITKIDDKSVIIKDCVPFIVTSSIRPLFIDGTPISNTFSVDVVRKDGKKGLMVFTGPDRSACFFSKKENHQL